MEVLNIWDSHLSVANIPNGIVFSVNLQDYLAMFPYSSWLFQVDLILKKIIFNNEFSV